MSISMDWTWEDIVDGLFFWATLTGRRGGRTPFVQGRAETPVLRRLRVGPTSSWEGHYGRDGCQCGGWKCSVLWHCPPTLHSISDLPSVPHICCYCLMNCAAGTNGCLNLRCHTSALDVRVSAEWSSCPGSMAWCARDSVAPLQRSSAGWMRARAGRLSAGEGRRHPVTIRKAGLIRWVWALRHQTEAHYSAVECTKARVAIRGVVALASHLRSATRDVSLLRSDSRCQQYVIDLSNVTPRYLGSEQKGRVSLLYLTLSTRLASLLLRWKAADTVFVVLQPFTKFVTLRSSTAIAYHLVPRKLIQSNIIVDQKFQKVDSNKSDINKTVVRNIMAIVKLETTHCMIQNVDRMHKQYCIGSIGD